MNKHMIISDSVLKKDCYIECESKSKTVEQLILCVSRCSDKGKAMFDV